MNNFNNMNENMDFTLYQQLSYIGHSLYRLRSRTYGNFRDSFRGQGRVLSILAEHPDISQKELSGLLDMRQQSLGELLGKLERSGYIQRTRSAKDGRAFDVHLSEKGAQAIRDFRETPKEDIPRVGDCFTDEEKQMFSAYLSRVIEKLREDYGKELQHADMRRSKAHKAHKNAHPEQG